MLSGITSSMGDAMADSNKVRENRLRRMAMRRRLHLRKSRRRDQGAFDYGLCQLVDIETGAVVAPAEGPGMTLDEVEAFLRGYTASERRARWLEESERLDG
jgi:hypothetical protein